jgi:hypothetical protein
LAYNFSFSRIIPGIYFILKKYKHVHNITTRRLRFLN